MVAFKYIFLSLATAHAWIVARDVITILNNLKAIDAAAKRFTADITAWDGTTVGSVTALGDFKNLDDKVNSASKELKSEPQENSADGQTLGNYFANPLKPDVVKAIDTLVRRKSDVQKASLTSLARDDLSTLRQDFNRLCQALFGVSASVAKGNPTGNQACSQLDVAFSSGISAFS